MRLFLDAHLSARHLAVPLRSKGHEVRAADEERQLDRWEDEDLLALAASERRMFITCDVKDFPGIARRWAEAARKHSGCAMLVGIDHSEFRVILSVIERELRARPRQDDWRNYNCFMARGSR